jgi:hypothetical protein
VKSAFNVTRSPARKAGLFVSGLRWIGAFALAVLALALCNAPTHITMLHPNDQIRFLGAGVTLGSNALTIVDWAKRLDPDGKVAKIVELLNQSNEILEDMLFVRGNLPTGHRTTVRVGLPTVAWRLLNQGVQPSKSVTAQIDEQCGKLEAWCEIDEDLVNLNEEPNEFRLSEAIAFIEAMNQTMAQTLFYGNSGTAPETFTGLAPRFSAIAGAANAANIINAGGAGGSCTSIWLVGWGPTAVHGIFPKGSKMGLQHRDLGLQVIETTAGIAGSRMMGFRDQWKWDVGIAVRDWRYAVRIANIKISTLIGDDAGATVKLVSYMSKAIDRIPNPGLVKMAFYCNRTVKSMLRIQALNKSNAALSIEEALNQFGERISVLKFLGVPVRTCDQILETEATIS